MPPRSSTFYYSLLLFGPSSLALSTTPAADFCHTVRVDCSTLSPGSGTCSRPPEVSSTAFNAQPPNLQPAPLMDMDFAILCPLVQRRLPHIRFLSIGSRLCSTLPSDPASRRRPCASLPFTSIRLGRDFHPLAVAHARRTTKRAEQPALGSHIQVSILSRPR
jgi:hypothetical protein